MMSMQKKSENMLSGKRILCVVDEESSNLNSYRQWVAAQIRQFTMHGAVISFLHPGGRLENLPMEYLEIDAELILTLPIEIDDVLERCRKLAQMAVKYGVSDEFDVVIGFGWTVSRGIAGGMQLAHKFWAVVDDFTDKVERSVWTNASSVESLFKGSRKVFVFNEEKRSLLEGSTPVANGRTYLPLMCQPIDQSKLHSFTIDIVEKLTVYIPGMVHPYLYIGNLAAISELAKSSDSSLSLCFDGSRELWSSLQTSRETAVLSAIPGLEFSNSIDENEVSKPAVGLVPDHVAEPWIVEFLVSNFVARGIVPVSMVRFISQFADGNINTINPASELDSLGFSESSIRAVNLKNRVRLLDAFGSRTISSVGQRTTRVVLAGADFKFAGDLVELLNDSPSIDLRVDLWDSNAQPNPERSAPFRDWADLVICEFSSFNAIWYSQNKLPGQRLVVRLHGYELLQPWIHQLNFEMVDKVVFVSEFYRQKAIESMGWPESKTEVISNTIDFSDLARPKLPGSEYHLGMAGLVPILKRPDRALDMLEILIREDDRFILHLRGHSPWNYGWEWKKQAHQAAYRKFYARIGDSELLRSHIAFEEFGPDMAGWFRKVGWVLSPSFRETFHLAPVEGMASGSLPIVWNRQGASDIFPKEHVFGDTSKAASFILETVGDKNRMLERSQGVQGYATKYSRSTVNESWLALVFERIALPAPSAVQPPAQDFSLEELVEAHTQTCSDATLLAAVREAWLQGEYSTAISLLDENITLTARDSGELKQWEHWVRGVFQASMNLEALVPPRSAGYVYQPKVGRIARVVGHHEGETRHSMRSLGAGTEEIFIGVSLPKPALDVESGSSADDTSGSFSRSIMFDGSLRANFYVSQVASELASEFRNACVSLAVSTGGLIEALATMLAARRIGIPFVWHPEGNCEAAKFLSRFNETLNDNPVHNIYQSILKNSDGLIASGCDYDINIALSAKIPIIDDLSLEALDSLYRTYSSISSPKTSSLSIVYVGDGSALESLRTVGEVSVARPSEIAHHLEKVPDVLIFEYGKLLSASDGGLIGSTELMANANPKLAQNAIVQARIMGVRTIFISSTDPSTLNDGKDLARRCDVVASNDRKSLISYMRLHPNSNQVNVNVSTAMASQVMPSIQGTSTPDVLACYDPLHEGKTRASALVEGRPFLAAWTKDDRWNDTKQPRSDYPVLRYEQTPTSENKIAAMWVNCFDLAQGRTAHDFATYLMRSAGFAAVQKKSIPIEDLYSANRTVDGVFTLGNTTVRIDENIVLDENILSDIVSLCRVSDVDSVEVVSNGVDRQKLTVRDVQKKSHVLDRVSNSEKTGAWSPPSAREFEAKGVSIILATYMGAGRVRTLLDSIARQTLPRSLVELIVVPNGPNDGTIDEVRTWADDNRFGRIVIAPQGVTGVANARNVGMSLATKEFITFVDDDDYLESNFLLALYARGSESTVVLGRLSDVNEETREVDRLTLTTNRVNELDGRVVPLAKCAGALGLNGAKLLPAELLRDCAYDSNLQSGEDVAFMAQLLKKDGVCITSAAELEESSYMRVLRSNSISRRDEDFQFMVNERLDVLKSLGRTREESTSKNGTAAIDELMTGQLGFMKRYVADLIAPDDLQRVIDAIKDIGMNDNLVLKPLIAELQRGVNDPETHIVGRRVPIH